MHTLILSSYFSVKKHPNDPSDNSVVGRGDDGRVKSNSFKYIEGWYNSVINSGVDAVLFYDEMDEEFVQRYQTNKIKFVHTNVNTYSNNDYRFFCFSDYLNNLEDKPEVVFHNDASDVTVVKDPFDLVAKNTDIDYFCCKDSIPLNQFPYIKIHETFGWDDSLIFRLNYQNWWLINMGVIGGTFEKMKNFYNKFVDIRESMGSPDFNADMWVLQYLIRSVLQPNEFMMGDPVCSEFKKYQNNREDVYFIHK
jgi:hypothetical protein